MPKPNEDATDLLKRRQPMKASIDISLYPLNKDYLPAIDAFIKALKQYPDIDVVENDLTTQIFGDFDVLMACLQTEIRGTFLEFGQGVFTLKVLKEDLRRTLHD
jgi:uncharacterized protein YqgV (UPF0045/DUF77 family)